MYFSVKFNIFIQSLVLKTAECDRIAQIGEHNAALHSWTQFLTPGVFPICGIIIEYLKISFKWLSNPDWKTNFTDNLSYLYICKPICNSKTQSIKLVNQDLIKSFDKASHDFFPHQQCNLLNVHEDLLTNFDKNLHDFSVGSRRVSALVWGFWLRHYILRFTR